MTIQLTLRGEQQTYDYAIAGAEVQEPVGGVRLLPTRAVIEELRVEGRETHYTVQLFGVRSTAGGNPYKDGAERRLYGSEAEELSVEALSIHKALQDPRDAEEFTR